ncbi:DUF6406 domain-containing protein [Lipingzhangella sp. LS1_29]|uniref:DUF6406 domain-containing protein n=1 Tax=Lipingzhangella rawalii TaxID=2055835 RepID=A0ABU2H7H1_9ACTN|nr:DUF6406 domain-containing protein [Lipingzhangella rawalii]MDS1271253.1 DUF6406 domain-containing protein [Lipingzhangella rawalii]
MASETATAPVLGEQPDRVQLDEGVPTSVEGTDGTAMVQVSDYGDGPEPSVTFLVEEDGQSGEHTLTLGESMRVAGHDWRLSEIGVSDDPEQPGSATLLRDFDETTGTDVDDAHAEENHAGSGHGTDDTEN